MRGAYQIVAALGRQGVPAGYINLFRDLHAGQSARVRADQLSKPYGIHRGTEQGDPLNTPMFNAPIEDAMADVKAERIRIRMASKPGLDKSTADDKSSIR